MIAPRSPDSPELTLYEATDAIFRPGGLLEQAGRGTSLGYEVRPQQREMALAVARSLEKDGHLVIEAGTGVGKSFAYLIPLVLHALRAKVHVIVSTHTISLQEQLMQKDVPFLQDHLGLDFKAALVKGRSNYLCLRRLARAMKMERELFTATQQEELEQINAWSRRTAEGSLQDLTSQPSSEVWNSVCVEHGNCLWQKCPEYKACFFMNARAETRDAQLLVVNHHLFFSDLALREQGASLLPDSAVCVLDEAHSLEAIASDHMGLRLSQMAFEHWIRRLASPEQNKGLLVTLKKGKTVLKVTQLNDEVEQFFGEVKRATKLGPEQTRATVTAPMAIETNIPSLLAGITKELAEAADALADEDVQAELQSACRRGLELRNALETFLQQALPDQVYWVETSGVRRKQTVLYSAPIEVAPSLERSLFGNYKSVVMTSATMSVNGSLDYFKSRVGATGADTLSVGSPFDYARQMRVFLPQGIPDPTNTEPFTEAVAKAIRHYVAKTRGHAFVLFTSDRFMRAVASQTRDFFDDEGFPLFVQGEGLPRHLMLDRFKKERGSVLFGLDSFWMGVDVKGDALANVIITKLPFAVPDEPVIKARMDRIKEQGGDPFKEFSIPEAILKFRQGIGRLIRSSHDEGIVVILDPRVRTKRYGRHFLDALPECPVVEDEIFS